MKFTDLGNSKQGSDLIMTLHAKVLGSILKLSEEQISCDQGVDCIILKLNNLYKKDELNEKFVRFWENVSYKTIRNQPTAV